MSIMFTGPDSLKASRLRTRCQQLMYRSTSLTLTASDEKWRTDTLDRLQRLRDGTKKVRDSWEQAHEIEEEIDRKDSVENLADRLPHHLANELSDAERKRQFDEFEFLAKDAKTEEGAKRLACRIIAESHERSRALHETEWSTQRGTIWISASLFAMCLLALGAEWLTDADLVKPPDDTLNATWFMGLLMLFGALGGMLSALVSLYLKSTLTDTTWTDPRPRLAFAKIAMGTCASVIGAMAVGTGLLVGNYQSVPAALLVGVAFGYSQQALTKFLDDRAPGIVASAKSES